MATPLIIANTDLSKTKVVEGHKLAISEMFANTIQGEGINAGCPATFIRLQGCVLKCVWCDTLDVWPYGNEYSFEEIFQLLEPHVEKYIWDQQSIVFTGGSPLKQQYEIYFFLKAFKEKYHFHPKVEIENEAVLMPHPGLCPLVHTWNNSPKLSNSKMRPSKRIRTDVLRFMSNLKNSWFKFVVKTEEDWKEIETDFLPYIRRDQIILMPEGQTQQELEVTRVIVAYIAIKQQVRYMDRLHVLLWNKRTGV